MSAEPGAGRRTAFVGLAGDVRQALRGIRRSPGFAAVVVLTLGLGIGASAAVFSLLDSVLLAPLAYGEPERLVRVTLLQPDHPDATRHEREFLSVPVAWALAERSDVFESLGVMNTYRELGADLATAGAPRRVRVLPVALAFFDVLGVPPYLGAGLEVDSDARSAVLSHGLWRSLGRDGTIVGRPIELDGVTYRVAGVMPEGFAPPLGHEADVWLSEDVGPTPAARSDWDNHYLEVIGRLAPGVTLAQAQQRIDAHMVALTERFGAPRPHGARLQPLRDATVGGSRTTLRVLMGAVGLLLLSACVNLANLFLARGLGRARELAVRVALGAGRARVLRPLLAESLILSTAGAAAGLGLAFACIRLVTAVRPEGLPRLGEIGVDGSVLLFTVILAAGTGLLFGTLPGVHFFRTSPGGALRDRVGDGGERYRGVQAGLVVAQVAATLLLLAGSGVLGRSFLRLQAVDLGFRPAGAHTWIVNLPDARYESPARRIAFHDALQDRIAGLPGVRASGAIDWLPVRGRYHPWGFNRLDLAEAPRVVADARVVSGRYFEAAGIPLLHGRDFGPADRADAPRVAILSRSAADEGFGGDAPGRRIRLLGREWEIVGVVDDVAVDPYGAIVPLAYLPHDQFADNRNWAMTQVVSWRGTPDLGSVRAEVAALDPALVVHDVRPFRDVVGSALGRQRFTLLVMSVFGTAAFLLAAVGLYGILSWTVRARMREFGVRVALGARPAAILGLVLGRSLRLTLAGIGTGLLLLLPLSRWLRSLVFDVSTVDPRVLGAAISALLAVGAAAAGLPALRASRVDPARLFRSP